MSVTILKYVLFHLTIFTAIANVGVLLGNFSYLQEASHLFDEQSDSLTCADPGIFVRGVHVSLTKKSSDKFVFLLVPSLFYRCQMINFKEIYHFSRFQRGSNIFQGGPTFFRGGPIAYSI